MNGLYLICGLGFISLVAEIANLKKALAATILLGLSAATFLVVIDWNSNLHYYNDMVVFDNFSIAFTALIIVIAIFWFWMAKDYFRERVGCDVAGGRVIRFFRQRFRNRGGCKFGCGE